STSHFVGMANSNAAVSWFLLETPPLYRLYDGSTTSNLVPRVRVNTTNTDGAALDSSGFAQIFNANAAASGADRQIVFLDITKGPPNSTFNLPFNARYAGGAGDQATDVSAANFLSYMAQTSPTPGGAYATSSLPSRTVAVDEAGNGTLNAINFYWSRADAS